MYKSKELYLTGVMLIDEWRVFVACGPKYHQNKAVVDIGVVMLGIDD